MAARISAAMPPFSKDVQDMLAPLTPAGREPLVLFTTLARDERLFKRFFAGGLLDRGNVTLRQREIVIDRTTALCRSEYEWGVHIAFFGPKAGLTDEQIRSLVHGGPADECWNPSDSLLIRFCDELHETATVCDEVWAAMKSEHSDEAMLELLMLAGFYHTVSYLTNAVRLPLEPDAARFGLAGLGGDG
jgi:alkylhydroperoxidase family enzyme